MGNRKFLTSTAEIFTLSLLFVSGFNLILRGEAAALRKMSALFALCGEGISFVALGELLVLSLLIAGLRSLWFSGSLFRNMLMVNRITLMLASVFCAAVVCSAAFGWFPVGMWQAWLGFVCSFAVGTAVSFAVMVLRTRAESRKYQRNLTAYIGLDGKEGKE